MDLLEVHTRLTELVKDRLGATLLDFHLVERHEVEEAYIVLWSRVHERGTHRAVLDIHRDEGMLVWGHYYQGPGFTSKSLQDFRQRAGLTTRVA